MLHRLFSILLLTFFLYTNVVYAQKDKEILSLQEAISDIIWLEQFIEDVHICPDSLYSGNSLKKSFFLLKAEITRNGSISRTEFYTRLLPIFYIIQDIHLYLFLPIKDNEYLKQGNYFLPFQMKIIGDQLYLINADSKIIPKGARIISINGYHDYEIIAKLSSASPSDGNNPYSRALIAEKNFIELFPLFFPVFIMNQIRFMYPGSEEITSINYPGNNKIKKYIKSSGTNPVPNYHEMFFFEDPYAAMIRIPSFSEGSTDDFKDFLNFVFNTISERNIEHFIIDMRGNEGGYAERGEFLLSNLISHDTPYINSIIFKHSLMADEIFNKQSKNSPLLKRMYVLDELLKMSDTPYGTYDTIFYSKTEPHGQVYEGKLYVLINGLSVSTTGLVCNALREHRGALFIGQPGGFTPQGTFGQVIRFRLPHSRIMGYMSTIRFNSTDSFSVKTTPFLPDIHVDETINDVINDKDPVLEQTLDIIRKKQD